MSIGAELLRFRKDQLYHTFDYETEGLNTFYSRPWQIAWSVGTLDKDEEVEDLYPWFEDLNMSKMAAYVTKFDFNEYKNKSSDPEEVLEKFEKPFLNPDIIKVGQNIFGLDLYIYNVFRRALGKSINWDFFHTNRFIDTNNIAKAIKKGIPIPPIDDIKASLEFNFKMADFHEKNLKTNLTHQGKELGIEFDYSSVHRGNNDIILNKLVLKKLLFQVQI